ncbi:TetR/AcrR family transcriptional regulator C-terminal domain-containing protein [Parablautia intestinalis]|uniref:TetR/AcrR family transcriptional regulator C-terminal domain-containing protein n=1 Tax=Parablautia intestinalis TaxID=2320100 RepID=UPI00256EB0EF|nr:TetR/AcrR family transcriptional regulator C-terminal domain-containing protein [Parablautia intestinalis]
MTHADISLKTKQAMVASLKKIAQKKPLSKITISELCHDCSINRKTFYYHFEDIYALVRWMLEQEALESVRSFDPLTDYKELIHFIIDYVDANNHILSCIYDTMGREGMKRVFLSDFKVCVNAIIERIEKDINASISPDYRQFLCDFYTNALAGILIDWFINRSVRSREEMIHYISLALQASLKSAIMEEIRDTLQNEQTPSGFPCHP